MSRSGKFIVLLRHGIAEDKRPGQSDFERQLTNEGHARMKEIARRLAEVFPDADSIYSSPLVRAVETAAHVAKACRRRSLEIRQTDALVPSAGGSDFRRLIEQMGGENIICVGHEPNLSAVMLDLTALGPDGAVSLKKGGFYGIRWSGRSGTLEWMVPPGVLV